MLSLNQQLKNACNIQVPQQKNEYDCGIFVLYFIKRFLEEAPQRLEKHDLSMVSNLEIPFFVSISG